MLFKSFMMNHSIHIIWNDLGGRLFECEVCSVWPFAGRVGCLSLHSYLQNPATRARV